MTTGEKIKFLRSEAKLSQTALAKMVGVSGQVESPTLSEDIPGLLLNW